MKRTRSYRSYDNRPAKKTRRSTMARKPVAKTRRYSRNQGSTGPELKNSDVVINQACNTTGVITLLNGVTQGASVNNRIGNKASFVSILLRGAISVGATPTSSAYRYLIVYDKQANATAPSIFDVLTNTNMAGLMNLDNRDRFVVLCDRSGWVEGTDAQQKPIKMYAKTQLETIYNGTGATVASITTGAIYLITLGSLVAGATAPLLVCNSRVRFNDS